MKQRVKLISDGTTQGTHIIDTAGNNIQGISGLVFSVDAGDQSTRLVITMLDVQVDVTATIDKGVHN